jgi:tRNA pseudouridine55 synthase
MISGVLLIDKPTGCTSNQVLQRFKKHFKSQFKVGHTGCLDPLATGVLPVVIGRGTRFADFMISLDKAYTATVLLGQTTTTGDSQGEVLTTCAVPSLTREHLDQVLQTLLGTIEQQYPAYSACRHEGKRFYELARAGKPIPVKTKQVVVRDIRLLSFDNPSFSFSVDVTKGTYIRCLAESIGQKLGCGAHITALRRDRVGAWLLSSSYSLEEVLSWDYQTLQQHLLPITKMIESYPTFNVNQAILAALKAGKKFQSAGQEQGWYQLQDTDANIVHGLVHISEQGFVKDRKFIEI